MCQLLLFRPVPHSAAQQCLFSMNKLASPGHHREAKTVGANLSREEDMVVSWALVHFRAHLIKRQHFKLQIPGSLTK